MGHGGAPPLRYWPKDADGNEYDPLPPQETWTDMYGGKPLEGFPENFTNLEKLNWKNYQEKATPKLFPSAEENLRIWQEMLMERQIDNHPVHEIHPNDLPDYHYWPMIQNDKEPKFTGQVSTLVQYEYHADQCEIPRFHKNGVPKTPPQEQVWYTPLDQNGRCDWRAAVAKFHSPESMFSKKGWNERYFRWAYQDQLFQNRWSLKITQVNKPIQFKHRELNWAYRFWRQKRGGFMAWPLNFFAIYFCFIGTIGSSNASFKDLNWEDEVWNYDMHYMRYFRDYGALHPPL